MPSESKTPKNLAQYIERLRLSIKRKANRGSAANLMMVSFILFTAIGCFLIYTPAGFISAGLTCGLFGFLLGQE